MNIVWSLLFSPWIELLNRKPQCKYGKECRTQNTVSHAKKYKHWFAEKISEDLEKGPSSDKVLDQNHGPTQEDQDLMDTEDEDSMDTDDSDADDNMII